MARSTRIANGDLARPLDSSGVQSVMVAVRVLEALATSGGPMGVTELARSLGVPKARVHRHLTTLRGMGLVDQERSTERYRLGWKLIHLGQSASEQFDLRKIAEPHLTRLRDAARQTAVLAVPAEGEALVIAAVENDNKISISVKPGNRIPPHCSAQGRLVLAFAPHDLRTRVLGRKLAAHTQHSLTDPKAIAARLEQIRQRLWENAPSEVIIGIDTLAAPLFDHGGELVGTVGIVGSVQFISDPPDSNLVKAVQGCAATICRALNSDAYDKRGAKALNPSR